VSVGIIVTGSLSIVIILVAYKESRTFTSQ
jgi:hypothetical protein